MAVHGYTKNYKLIKPEFNSDTWHDYEYENLDTIDAVLSAIYASGQWRGFWKNDTLYHELDVVIDRNTDTMYKVVVEHTTDANVTFEEYKTNHPEYYQLWSPNNLAEDWAIKDDGLVDNQDYSAKAHASSEGLVPTGSAKEWANQSKQARDDIFNNENFETVSDNINDVNTVGQNIDSVITNATNIDIIETTADNIDAVINAQSNAEKSRIWATGSDPEVQELEANEHSSRTYSNMAMAIANAPEDVPILESQLLATNVIQGEPWAGGEVTTPLVLVSDDNHPIAIRGMAGASATGYQIIDGNGLGESDFEHYATGDRYGTRITNKNNTSGTTTNIDLYQSNVGRSVLDLSEVQTILAPALLGAMYPVGSIYITTNATCPIADLGVGTWELVAEDRVLQGAGTRGAVGTTLNESLPNITGFNVDGAYVTGEGGCFYNTSSSRLTGIHNTGGAESVSFDASRSSSAYQDDAPVQPDAYLVNIFRRVQ